MMVQYIVGTLRFSSNSSLAQTLWRGPILGYTWSSFASPPSEGIG